MTEALNLSALAAGLTAAGLLGHRVWQRLQLSRAKHPSLTGHARMARRMGRWLPGYHFDADDFFQADGAGAEVVARRQAGFERLSTQLSTRHPQSVAASRALRQGLSDLQFTSAYRVPYPFSPLVREQLPLGSVFERTEGHRVIDLDGQVFDDLSGSYGVNLFGHEFYKRNLQEAQQRALPLGMLLGAYHPATLDVVQRLRRLSGQDEVSFHMSGTEAVMQAVRLARYHSGKQKLVRFCGAYHGWWGEVQPGPGNPTPADHTYTLRDMSERSLRVLKSRRDIACVLVNPLQALHPNQAAPGDSSLVGQRQLKGADLKAYADWLRQLRQVCTERGIALIFDEVFVGFRLAPGGAQQLFGVQADLVTYGKTLGGGLPVGVLCGQARWMKRFRAERPADLCFARGTFNAHPQVICAMQVFLEQLERPEVQALYTKLNEQWTARAQQLNLALHQAGHPVGVAQLGTIWALQFNAPGRYHWMLQFYLRAQGLLLSWVGSGRIVWSLDYSQADFDAVCQRVLAACAQMRQDGWWDGAPAAPQLKRRLLKEIWQAWRA
ncbi:glutamate-1-semialdehyde 2,1-aminomutase [Inhella inkyongensis]|uniref:Glutamate-1-semialdehyde 2,1-aminomutase n=1 Tax=Inhella inkyongensis TaxID=392593 RepID=A0A840S2W2_9BURK|nr:aminotransferase class III-fold pyridoxal phosphate-dependent enzyme [Inhella inkyongensis]MBB5203872.1 glutamate-1-semialdehyde 2,1-aminomutase [Inhella inkyongensis]